MNISEIQRIKPIKRVYAGQFLTKSRKCKLPKGKRSLLVHSSNLKEKYLCPKNLHSLYMNTPGTPLAVQKLKSQSCVQSLYIEMSMQKIHHLNLLLKLLKRFKKLRVLQLHAYNFNISTKENCLWYERLFKLCRHQHLTISPLCISREIMKKLALPKFIHQISSLKQIVLNIQVEVEDEDDESLRNLTSLCQALSTCHLDLTLSCISDNINAFVPRLLFCLLNIKNLKGLTFWHRHLHFRQMQIQENHFPRDIDFPSLFSPHKKLRKLAISSSFDALMVRFFPFEEFQDLKDFGISLGAFHLKNNEFAALMARVKTCKKLTGLNFRLTESPLLTDLSVQNFCNELIKSLPDLETLDLMLGYAPHPSHVTSLRPQTCQHTPLAINYLAESLPIMRKIKRLNLGFQIKELTDFEFRNLFDALSKLKTLEVLEISVFSGSITDSISPSIKQCLQSLMCLQTFEMALRKCEKLTNSFLEGISSGFTIKNVSKSLRTIQLNFEHSSLSKESINECISSIKTQLPSCNVHLSGQ